MTTRLRLREAALQAALPGAPYDTWIDPDGKAIARFHREPGGFLLRFVDQVDFRLEMASGEVVAIPTPHVPRHTVERLFANAVGPLLANHAGRLTLHGSAVALREGAVAFIGASRRGKTTLAAAFARQGHPFLSEDVLALRRGGGGYIALPADPRLRLFGDSADTLADGEDNARSEKFDIAASDALPHCDRAMPLSHIFLLGPGDVAQTVIEPMSAAAALAALLPHAFVLDCEDRDRLEAHFTRMADLAEAVSCSAIDYPRDFASLPDVVTSIAAHVAERQGSREQ